MVRKKFLSRLHFTIVIAVRKAPAPLLKVKLKESALVNVNRTDVLSKSIHLGVN